MISKIIRACLVALTVISGTASAGVSVGYEFALSKGTGQFDHVLTRDALSAAVYRGLRDGGLVVMENPQNVDVLISAQMTLSFEPEFQSLRILSGTFVMKVPQAGATNFSQPIMLCDRSIHAWRAGTNDSAAAQKLRDDVYRQAKAFAQQCHGELTHR